MFEICLSYKKGILDIISLNCTNCKRETGLDSEKNFSWLIDEVITKFVLNSILHHVGMSWITSSNKEMKYEMNGKN